MLRRLMRGLRLRIPHGGGGASCGSLRQQTTSETVTGKWRHPNPRPPSRTHARVRDRLVCMCMHVFDGRCMICWI